MDSLSRRKWIKRSALGLGALTLSPFDSWANRVSLSQIENKKFLYPETQPFNEFTPPFPITETPPAILAWNENPYGFSPKAVEAMQTSIAAGNRYGWMQLNELKKKIAKKEGVGADQIMMGPGSTDLLERTAMFFFKEGGEANVITANPAYMSVVDVAQALHADWKAIKLTKDYDHDLKAMEKAIDEHTKLVYIANPNNPTGTVTNKKDLVDFCKRISKKVPVFVDEAYLEFSKNGLEDSMISLVKEGGYNVIVARTFSKIHGMAGLRCGYIVASKDLISKLNSYTIPGFGTSVPTITAVDASLYDEEHLEMCRTNIVRDREITESYLKKKKLNYLPSNTNFIIFEIPMDGKEMMSKLYEHGVMVRTFKFWDKNWCRVTIGKTAEMKIFYDAMDKIFV
ncbi:pyridoxal phosphate-dependent aminotransferase [Neptunitalea lumnitzerae]|uniref:Histidinol-phosphate aminotransferase n=1 Tax=Neptunitalea lumnitzerae TaxID=2965509 RepID=A0ABQ5MJN9_9FLAO|nr:histidinol-phosphate transaminase [Neptunitalea sp. Y10]GLB49552.1 histidinol-phosphate aminotransferase [Neptunitalea sp. Y10]